MFKVYKVMRNGETKGEKRENKKRKRMPQHGKGLAMIYNNCILKRMKKNTPA